MEFWVSFLKRAFKSGIEIKPGSPINVELEDGYLIHVSQVTLGDLKKVKDETVSLYVKVGGDDKQKLIIGNLSQKIPQVSLDLMFEQDFELSHECKSSSVFVLGYKTPDPELGSDFDSDEEEIPMDMFKSELEKSSANANGLNDQKANLEAGESDTDEEDESDSDEMGSDDDEDDSDEEEEAPLKVEPPSKKRPNGGAMNNTNASKKAKVGVPQKPSGGHKGHKCGGVHPPKRN